ncbi:MAG TPA: DUF2339 domain-containing protein [Noviherbaspirillum sp.]
MELGIIAIAAILYVSLLSRINKLERRIIDLEGRRTAAAVGPDHAATATAPSEPKPSVQSAATASPIPAPLPVPLPVPRTAAPGLSSAEGTLAAPHPVVAPSALEETTASILALIRKNPFATAGVLMLLIGAGFLLSLLAANNILPPALRVLAAALAGAAVFVVGLRQLPERTTLGLNLQGGALALEYLCALWAYQGYQLISTITAFWVLAALSTMAFAWAVRTERVLFALVGLTGALLTPIIATSGNGTFGALTLYATWVSLLSVGVGLRLRSPSLVSVALAGTSGLLGAALDLPRGDTTYTIAGGLIMALAYNAAALFWTVRTDHLDDARKVSVVSVLVGASLIMSGFLAAKAAVSSEWCAVLIGVTALAGLLAMHWATTAWKGWLLAIGSGLSLIAIGIGLDGASRAIALAASALGLILIAHSLGKAMADMGAALYWLISVVAGYHAWESGAAGTTPLAVSALVALGASYVNRERQTGLFYAACAPLVLDIALLRQDFDDPARGALWFLLWATLATMAGRVLRWRPLRLSALWLLPAGMYLFVTPIHDISASALMSREILLAAWLTGSALLMRLYRRDEQASVRLEQSGLSLATMLVPLLANIELARVLDLLQIDTQTILAASMVHWAGWSAIARGITILTGFDWQAKPSSAVAVVLTAIGVAIAPPGWATEASQWASLAIVALVLHYSAKGTGLPAQVIWGLAGAVLIGTLLRLIGTMNGLHDGALELLFERPMQPWVSVFWAAAGVTVVMTASQRRVRNLWVGGGIALAVLIVKMLLIDLSALTLVAKVTVFLVVGVGFLGLGYFCPLPPEQGADEPVKT